MTTDQTPASPTDSVPSTSKKPKPGNEPLPQWVYITSFFVGVALVIGLIGTAIHLEEIKPQPFFFMRIGMCLATAAFAAAIPGLLKVYLPIWGSGSITAVGAIATFVIIFYCNPPRLEEDGNVVIDGTFMDKELKKFIESGLKEKKKYIIESATIQWDLTLSKSGTELIGVAKNEYNILLLDDLSGTDATFDDWMEAEKDGTVIPIPGNRPQRILAGSKILYDITGKKWERKTVANSFCITRPWPMQGNRSYFSETLTLRSNDWMYDYPNDGDYIRRITIIIRSNSLDLGNAMGYRLPPDRKLTTQPCLDLSLEGYQVISNSWESLQRNDAVGIKIQINTK